MNPISQLAKHFRDVHFGGNWTWSNLRDNLADVTWQEATTRVDSLNTIAALVYHINYYVGAILGVLQGQPLLAKDKFSFDVPPIQSQEDWETLLTKMWTEAEALGGMIEQLPQDKLWDTFVDEKYGTYYRNFQGVTEHSHYHLGQIVVIKKLIRGRAESAA